MIVRTRGGADMQMRTDLGTLLSQYGLGRVGYGASAGVPVTTLTVAGIPAVHKAVNFAAQTVATLGARGIAIWRDAASYREQVKGCWQARLFRGTPNDQQTWYSFWEAVQASLDFRGNAYIWKSKDPESGRVVALYCLHPDQIYLRRENNTRQILFRVAFGPAYVIPPECQHLASITAGTDQVLFIRGRGGTGELVAPSPITLFRSALGVNVALQQRSANVLENGVHGGLLIQFPAATTPEQAKEFKEIYNAENSGPLKAGQTKVLGGGATVTQIGMTQQDAQFVDWANLSLLDISMIFDVPAWILGQNEKAEKTQLPEHEEARWVNHGLIPRLSRIEAAFYSDPDLFGPASLVYPAFNIENLIQGDVQTMDAVYHNRIQDGRMVPDEWRIPNGYPPLPNGVGEIPQIVPVGGSPVGVPNPVANLPSANQ